MTSILTSTKRLLNIEESDTSFDLDIVTYINTAFSTLNQLGVGPEDGFFIEDNTADWADYLVPANQLHLIKSYVALTARMKFDPPATSYHTASLEEEIEELVFRIHIFREVELAGSAPPPDFILDGGGP